jgi:hypothetical protein
LGIDVVDLSRAPIIAALASERRFPVVASG